MAEIGGTGASKEEMIFPHFIFRRIGFQWRYRKLSWRRRIAVLSSATLEVIVNAKEEGFDLGGGIVPFSKGVSHAESVLGEMRRRLTWK